jgi:hypothetical protein
MERKFYGTTQYLTIISKHLTVEDKTRNFFQPICTEGKDLHNSGKTK